MSVDGAKTSDEGPLDIELHQMPVFEDLFTAPASNSKDTTDGLPTVFDSNGPALILHSSGTTLLYLCSRSCNLSNELVQAQPHFLNRSLGPTGRS